MRHGVFFEGRLLKLIASVVIPEHGWRDFGIVLTMVWPQAPLPRVPQQNQVGPYPGSQAGRVGLLDLDLNSLPPYWDDMRLRALWIKQFVSPQAITNQRVLSPRYAATKPWHFPTDQPPSRFSKSVHSFRCPFLIKKRHVSTILCKSPLVNSCGSKFSRSPFIDHFTNRVSTCFNKGPQGRFFCQGRLSQRWCQLKRWLPSCNFHSKNHGSHVLQAFVPRCFNVAFDISKVVLRKLFGNRLMVDTLVTRTEFRCPYHQWWESPC